MNAPLTIGWVLTLGLLSAPVARAEPPIKVQTEVNLRDKYKYLVASNLVNTAEEFIERAATESSFSGKPYEVRCNGGATMTSNQWLRKELTRIRTF